MYEPDFETNFDPNEAASEGLFPFIATMEPSLYLAAALSEIDVHKLSGHDRVIVMRAYQRMATHFQGQVYQSMAAITDTMHQEFGDNHQLACESAAQEIRAALNLTRRASDSELSFALDLYDRLPDLAGLLDTGVIDVKRARIITEGTSHLSVESARSVFTRIKDTAPGLTTGQIRARVMKLCIEADPHEAKERYEHAIEDRRVVATPTVAGAATLTGENLPPDQVTAITARINQIARSLRRDGETRTMDQLRADIYLDLLLDHTTNYTTGKTSGKTTGKTGLVDLRVDLDTLIDLSDHPGELNGFGPIIADIARQIVVDHPDAQWRYTVTDTETGEPLHDGVTKRRPTTSVRRTVTARDQTCVFPGCRMPAINSDLDHTTPYTEGGETNPGNLATLCRYDHRIRHQAGWTYQPIPVLSPEGRRQNTGYQWRSRLGHTYTTNRAPP